MKKTIILLSSLAIAVTTFSGGKEIIPPEDNVIVKEVFVERPVYRNILNGGYLNMFYRWWGESSSYSRYDQKHYNRSGNRGRLQIDGLINLTEQQSIYFRIRDNQSISDIGDGRNRSGENTQVRMRYMYNHEFTSLNATSRLHYQNTGEYIGDGPVVKGDENFEYQFRMQFVENGFDNDFVKTTNLVIAPKVGYSWDHSSSSNHHASSPYYGLNIEFHNQLPWNFSLEINTFITQVHSNNKYYDGKRDNFSVSGEVFLKNKTPLWTGDKATLSFVFEGGLDPYVYSLRKVFDHSNGAGYEHGKNMAIRDRSSGTDKYNYSVFAVPALQIDYQATENINLYVAAGAEMRNIYEVGSEAQGFEWQPTAWAGFRSRF